MDESHCPIDIRTASADSITIESGCWETQSRGVTSRRRWVICRTRRGAPVSLVAVKIVSQVSLVPGIEPDLRRDIRFRNEGLHIAAAIGAGDLKLQALGLAQLPQRSVTGSQAEPEKICALHRPQRIAEIYG